MRERRNQIRTKLIVTFILLVTALVVASAMVWYRVATAHVRRETENRLLAVAEAGALVIDPLTTTALVNQVGPRTRQLAEGHLRAIQRRLGVQDAYVFDPDQRVLATTDTLRMDVGEVAPGLANYAREIERVLQGEAVVTAPFSDERGNVYQTALVPLVGYVDEAQTREAIVAILGVDLSLGFLYEETLAIALLIYGGVLDRHPELDVCLSHGGGASAYMLGRLAHQGRTRPWAREHPVDFTAALRRMWFDNHVHDQRSLELLGDQVGRERLVLGTNLAGWDAPREPDQVVFDSSYDVNAKRLLRLG